MARGGLRGTRIFIGVVTVCAIAFGVYRAVQGATGLGAPGPSREQRARAEHLTVPTLAEIETLYRNSAYSLKPGVGAVLVISRLRTEEGTILVSRQVAPGGRMRQFIYDQEGVISGFVVDGEHAWTLTPDGCEDAGEETPRLLVAAQYEPLFVDAKARGHSVRRIEHRGEYGMDGLWVVVDASDGSVAEYKIDRSRPQMPVPFVRWTWPDRGEGSTIDEIRYEGIYGIAADQCIPSTTHVERTTGERTLSMQLDMMQCAVVPSVPDHYFTPDGLDTDLWDYFAEHDPG